MAPVPPRLRINIAWLLLDLRLDELQTARTAAINALARNDGEMEAMVRRRLGLANDDPWPDGDPSDPDDPISNLYDDAAEHSARSQSAAVLTRKAFLIVLFHLWERHCTSAMKRKRYDHDEVVAWLKAIGKPVRDELKLRALELACHCAKHGAGNSSARLWNIRPDLFQGTQTVATASDRNLVISDETLDDFYNLVATI